MSGDLHETGPIVSPKEREETKTRLLPPYNVVLKNDDFHSFEFVLEVLKKTLGHNDSRAFQLTNEAHTKGRAIVWTGPKEVAEFRVEQIQTHHETRRADGRKLGPLDCYIEPAPGA